jgi:Zn-dependent M28 family amino/carboxypeptidase
VTVLEIAERLAAMPAKPKRSVLFVWHTGEEKGLLGSAWYTEHPTVPRDSVVAQLNLDMVGRGAATDVTGETRDGQPVRGGPDYVQLVGSRRLSTELGDLVESVNRDGRLGLAFDYSMDANGHPMNIYCRSDHYSYARYGIPVTSSPPAALGLPPGDRRAAVHRLRAHGARGHARGRRGGARGEPRPPRRGRQAEAGPKGSCQQ